MEAKLMFYSLSYTKSDNLSISDMNQSTYEAIQKSVFEFCKSLMNEDEAYTDESDRTKEKKDTSKFRYIVIRNINAKRKSIFGLIGKTNKATNVPMQRIYPESNPSKAMDDLLLDNYSYFLIKFIKDKVVLCSLSNYRAPKVQALFSIFFASACNDLVQIKKFRISPELDRHYIKKIKRAITLNKLSFRFNADSEMNDQTNSFKETFNLSQQDEILVSAQIKFTATPADEEFKQRIVSPEFVSNFNSLKVTLEDENDRSETIDVLEHLLTKSVTIEIPDDENSSISAFEAIEDAMWNAVNTSF